MIWSKKMPNVALQKTENLIPSKHISKMDYFKMVKDSLTFRIAGFNTENRLFAKKNLSLANMRFWRGFGK